MVTLLATASISSTEEATADISFHVTKHPERFIFQDVVAVDSVPVSYIESVVVDPGNILGISRAAQSGSYSTVFADQAKTGNNIQKVKGTTYSTVAPVIEATPRFFTDVNGKKEPLWYKHVLPQGVLEATIRKTGQGEVPETTGLIVDISERAVYTNHRNYFSPETGAWCAYFVDYITPDGPGSELLTPVPAVTPGTVDDIDPDTGFYPPNLLVYDRIVSGLGYEYNFNVSTTYWIRHAEDSALTLKPPAQFATDNSWFIQITNGQKTIGGSVYSITEWATQPFYPASPYRRASGRRLRWVSPGLLSANRRGVTVVPGDALEVSAYKEDRTLVTVYTTDASKEGTSINGVPYTVVSSVADPDSGLIWLGAAVDPGWTYIGEYSYASTDFEVETVDLNPVLNPRMRDGGYVFYVLPDLTLGETSVHWVYVKDQYILETSQGDAGSYTNRQLTDTLGAYNADHIIGPAGDGLTTLQNDDGAMLLGAIGLKNMPNLWDVFEVDVRRWGPQLAESAAGEVWKYNPKALYTDLGYGPQGQQVPGPQTVVVDMPIDILETYGGNLSEVEVREEVDRYLGASSYAYINWTYPRPELTITNGTSGTVDVLASYEAPGDYKLLRRVTLSDTWTTIDTDTPVAPADAVLQDLTAVVGSRYWYAVQVGDYPVGNAIRIEVI